ncbi:hypothetical protein ABEB36_002024 [Hypothenemus hampei]|uniref:Uncharacterized protein n=1 Tax=Hypothenemus hampei TaxID=57062 RepID=A0ABD1F4D1_HYPHA
MEMMSSKQMEYPREGPVDDGESLTSPTKGGVCPTEYGGGNATSFAAKIEVGSSLHKLINPFDRSAESCPATPRQDTSPESAPSTVEVEESRLEEISSSDDAGKVARCDTPAEVSISSDVDIDNPGESGETRVVSPKRDARRVQKNRKSLETSVRAEHKVRKDRARSQPDPNELSFWSSLMGGKRKTAEEGSEEIEQTCSSNSKGEKSQRNQKKRGRNANSPEESQLSKRSKLGATKATYPTNAFCLRRAS